MAGAEDLLFHDVVFTIFSGPTIGPDQEERVRIKSLHGQDSSKH